MNRIWDSQVNVAGHQISKVYTPKFRTNSLMAYNTKSFGKNQQLKNKWLQGPSMDNTRLPKAIMKYQTVGKSNP